MNGGSCADLVNGYSCNCSQGFAGTNCQTDIDECGSGPCVNGGSCIDLVNSYRCDCASGYAGTTCDIGKFKKSLNNFKCIFMIQILIFNVKIKIVYNILNIKHESDMCDLNINITVTIFMVLMKWLHSLSTTCQ
ncbi:hypothetical protein FSP39_017811 [Pinctada imbricata]|uniref:EGF-like domain-containing protein n=1 Tax=Pinctada imbricata TaxID=66713 RepID=A0AA89CC86_PINIB|nr:hypothetical protein FSP39_017811 [Pinctada imbricata]